MLIYKVFLILISVVVSSVRWATLEELKSNKGSSASSNLSLLPSTEDLLKEATAKRPYELTFNSFKKHWAKRTRDFWTILTIYTTEDVCKFCPLILEEVEKTRRQLISEKGPLTAGDGRPLVFARYDAMAVPELSQMMNIDHVPHVYVIGPGSFKFAQTIDGDAVHPEKGKWKYALVDPLTSIAAKVFVQQRMTLAEAIATEAHIDLNSAAVTSLKDGKDKSFVEKHKMKIALSVISVIGLSLILLEHIRKLFISHPAIISVLGIVRNFLNLNLIL